MGNKVAALTFALLAFTAVKATILLEEQACVESEDAQVSSGDCFKLPSTQFPNFNVPFNAQWNPNFTKVGGVDFVADAIGNLGVVIAEIGEFIAATIQWLFVQIINTFKLTAFVLSWFLFLIVLMFTTVPGSPWYVSLVLVAIPVGGIFTIIALIRGGGGD